MTQQLQPGDQYLMSSAGCPGCDYLPEMLTCTYGETCHLLLRRAILKARLDKVKWENETVLMTRAFLEHQYAVCKEYDRNPKQAAGDMFNNAAMLPMNQRKEQV